jgi:two-component system OmpR family sensor kinase
MPLMDKWRWLLPPLLVFMAGLGLATVLWAGLLPDPIITLRIDLGNLSFFGGLLVGVSWAVARRWAQAQLSQVTAQVERRAADERRRFLGRLDHELKNPLTAVRAGLANLSEAPSEALRQEAFASVEAQALRLSRLAADLRKLADLETRPLERSSVDLAAMLQEAFDLAQDQPGAAGRRLSLNIPRVPWPLPTIPGDRDLLFLSVHNLLDNAIKFTEPGNAIEVRAYEDNAFVVVEVADTGPGIPEDEIEHVWEELYRGKSARRIPGSGLGLPLVRAIVARHGGQATLRSRAGQGTVVTLRLPV